MPSSSIPKLEQTARSRQLYLLSFLADVLVDLLNCDDDDEIEMLRSSSTTVKPPQTQSGYPKQELAESCLPLLKNSQQIITKVRVLNMLHDIVCYMYIHVISFTEYYCSFLFYRPVLVFFLAQNINGLAMMPIDLVRLCSTVKCTERLVKC